MRSCARPLDEGEILVGQRQDRDPGEVDLLGAGELEQQVERAFEAVDVDDQRGLRRPRRRPAGSRTRHRASSNQVSAPASPPAIIAENAARAPSASNGSGGLAQASARAARSAARPASARRGGGDLRHLRHLAVAVQQRCRSRRPATPGAVAEAAAERLHRQVVGHQQAVEADRAADHLADHLARGGGRARRRRCRRRRRGRSSPSAGRQARGRRRSRSPPASARGVAPPAVRGGCRRWPGHGRGCA